MASDNVVSCLIDELIKTRSMPLCKVLHIVRVHYRLSEGYCI